MTTYRVNVITSVVVEISVKVEASSEEEALLEANDYVEGKIKVSVPNADVLSAQCTGFSTDVNQELATQLNVDQL